MTDDFERRRREAWVDLLRASDGDRELYERAKRPLPGRQWTYVRQ